MEQALKEEIMTMMSNQIENLENMLEDAIHNFAKVALEECEPRVIFDKKAKCQIIEAQLNVLKDLMRHIATMKREIEIPQFKNV